MSSMPDQQKVLEHFRAALPETTDLTDGQVRILLNHLGIELSEERLRKLMAAASDESGKVTWETFISWMFGCDEKAEAEKVERGQVQPIKSPATEPKPEAKGAMEDNSPSASSSQTGLVERFKPSHVSQGKLSSQVESEASSSSLGRLDGSEDRLQQSVAKVQEPEEVQEAIKKPEHEVHEPPEEEVRVDLEDPAALATFLVTANIKLIRAEYLVHLVTQDRRLPRRQEAEGESFVDFAGKTRSALVDHEEVQAWAAGSREAIIVSVSHAWEAREHPDPCGYQLEWVAQHASLFVAAFAADIWLFFDYVSLFQFKREKGAEEQGFRRSMENMHAMYAHESTITFRLESLTPEERWQKAVKDGSQVTIFHFHDTSGLVEPVPLQALTSNTNAYLDRGWCRAEVSWSSARGDTAQNQRIDVVTRGIVAIHRDLTGRTPVAPDVFAADMHSAAFTHRSDADAVIDLQKKVFREKLTKRRQLKVEGVSRDQMQVLAQSLPHFKQLKSITVIDFRCSENEAKAFVEALAATPIDKISLRAGNLIPEDLEGRECLDSFFSLLKALFAALASKTLKATQLDLSRMPAFVVLWEVSKVIERNLNSMATITDLDLSGNHFFRGEWSKGWAEDLAEALKENRTLKRLNLAHNDIGLRGVEALQKSLQTNTTLEHLELDETSDKIPEAAEAIEAACCANPRICKPSAAQSEASDGWLKSPFEAAVRIKGLADQLRLNNILTYLDLKDQNICDEKAKALADAFRVNRTITYVNLSKNKFGDEGLKALAGAFRVNETIMYVDLTHNNFGDEGLKALASAIEVNETITEVKLDMEEDKLAMLSDEGHQAMGDIQRFCGRNKVQPVCESCRSQSITEVNVSRKNLGDEEVKALADAFCVNKSVTKVDLSCNNFGDEGLKALADSLRVNNSMTTINLWRNNFGDEGVKALADAFCVNESVTQVDLRGDNFGDEGLKALASAMEVNETIMQVQISAVNAKLSDEGRQAMEDIQHFCGRNKSKGLPSNWEEHMDIVTGQTFYYNKVTKESSWDVPAGGAPPAP